MKKPKKEPPKKIFLFSDGTGNSAAKLTKTNVWRMYEALDKSKPNQIAIYDNGVGTSSFRPLMLIGGAFGVGLKRNVLELYEFLCKHYNRGDQVYLIGFSRGAFTMRLLAALIGSQGIIRVGFEPGQVTPENLGHYSRLAYQRLTRAFPTRGNFVIAGLRHLRSGYSNIKAKLFGLDPYEDIERCCHSINVPPSPMAGGLEPVVSDNGERSAEIAFMGLFDTVSAYGGPVKELTKAFSWLFWPSEPTDWYIGDYVKKVCHALALDEPRQSFRPKLISEADPKTGKWADPSKAPTLEEGDRIEQVWFSGAHSNVGGGYPNDGLSMITLNWMIEQLQKKPHSIQFNTDRLEAIKSAQNCCAPIYDPRRGVGGVYRYDPRNLRALTEDLINNVYVKTPKLHKSVIDRVIENPGYAPIAINKEFVPVDNEGKDLSKGKEARYKKQLDFRLLGDIGIEDSASTEHQPLEVASMFNGFIEKAWDRVWGRRVVHIANMFVGLAILFAPLFVWLGVLEKFPPDANCQQWHCFLQKPVASLANVLPGLASPWIDAIRANMSIALTFIGAWIGLFIFGRYQKGRINLTLAQFWDALFEGKEDKLEEPEPSGIYALRNHPTYIWFFQVLKNRVMVFAWGVVLLYGLIAALNQGVIYLRDHSTPSLSTCKPPETGNSGLADADIRKLCNSLNFKVAQGQSYIITISPTAPDGEESCVSKIGNLEFPWRDKSIAGSPDGLANRPDSAAARLGLKTLSFLSWPIRRHLSTKLFAPVIRIGRSNPSYPETSPFQYWWDQEKGSYWSARFTASQSGQAYYFVNDAMWGPLGESLQNFYGNNCGFAKVEIKAE